MPDGSSVRLKVAQYYVNKAQAELEAKNPRIEVGDWPLLQALPQFEASPEQFAPDAASDGAELRAAAAAAPAPLPPIFQMPADNTISWKDLLDSKIFSKPPPTTGTGGPPTAPMPAPTPPHEGEDRAPRMPTFPTYPSWYRVAIIGSGVAGLRSAKLLEEMGIPYDILEASDRPGGRIFTYHFPSNPPNNPQGKHDYYDVGAMRFPRNEANEKTFELFDELGLTEKLNDYVFSNDNNILFFNGKKASAAVASTAGDHFNDEAVPEEYLLKVATDLSGNIVNGVNACTAVAFDDLRNALITDFDSGWEQLMQYDWASTRSYLVRETPQFPLSVAQWMENRNSGTGGYNESLTETVLESLSFDDPTQDVKWSCIEGGTQLLIDGMRGSLHKEPLYNSRVSAVEGPILMTPWDCYPDLLLPPWHRRVRFPFMRVKVANQLDRYYAHVISTVPFANLGMVNTDAIPMSYHQRQAIRSLNYGPSCKVGIKFKSRWWEQNGQQQFGGSSYTDRPSRVIVYPSYGLREDGPGVLLVSYTWNQDALRLGSLIQNPSWSQQLDPDRQRPVSEQVMLDRIYEDLSVLHGVTIEQLKADTLDYHAFDWYGNPFTMGAFAMFTPGQFGELYPDILQPAGRGRFHFAGEVASAHHAWVAGALDSAIRVVDEILRFDFPLWLDPFQHRFGMSAAFVDEKHAKTHFTKGVFNKELEKAELRG